MAHKYTCFQANKDMNYKKNNIFFHDFYFWLKMYHLSLYNESLLNDFPFGGIYT